MKKYDKIDYCKINISDEYLFNMISDKEKLSITRFGDGELCFFLKNFKISKVMSKIPTFSESILKSIVINSWNYSDIVGVGYFPLEPQHQTPERMRRKIITQNFAPISIFENLPFVKKEYICDHRINRNSRFATRHMAKRWVKSFDLIHIIGDYADKVKDRGIEELWNKECVFTNSPNPFICGYRSEFIELCIKKSIDCDLVIWGCGLPVKDMGYIISNEANCVTIDMGSALDGWAGHHARPVMDKHYSYMFE